MDIIKQFKEILTNKTRNGFHDATLLELKIRLEKNEIYIEIEHWKDGDKDKEEKIYIGKFLFREISNIYLDNKVNCFGIEDEISNFETVGVSTVGWISVFAFCLYHCSPIQLVFDCRSENIRSWTKS